ncbi:hypothetical protein A4X13_0g7409 [Tilletia indica]|uniref:DUF6589 domain-containing protein n=1 Tax=Tilletia indica TaxID=43049 RepID=A0A177TQY7_9BASI|nr:hypothetical protein A4X13_0g7409 [Tilletia indica]
MSHQGMSTKEVHAERVQGVFGQLGHHQLNFGKFILGTLRSQQSEIRSIMTKWMRLSHSVAQVEEEGSSIEAVEASHKYGPEDVLNAIIEEVYRRGDEKGVKRLKHVLLKQAAPLMVEELEDFCKNKSQYLRVSSTQVDQCSNLHTSLPPIVDLYRKELPAIFQLFSSLVDKDMAGEDNDVFGVHNQASALTAVERIIVPCISSMVYTRNRLLNRFQMLVGSFLAVTDAPDTVKGFISHCGLSVTQPTTRKALESISEAAIPSARALFADKALVKVFLFDNINIYMRRRQTRITDYSTTAALTMRTILALPSTCSPRDFTQAHIRKLRDADRSAITMNDVLPDEKFLERAAEIHIARSLLDVISVADRTRSAIRRRLEELCSQHEMNLADPQATKFTCLKLLRQNEGTLEGIQAVLTETTEDVNSDADPFLVAGDLLTVRNTQAVQDAGRYEDDDSLHRIDYAWAISGPWHLLQSWLYLIFQTYFSDTKAGKDGSLDGIRQVLRRGRTALREDKPLFNEAWEFGKHVWAGRIRAILDTERRQDPKTKLQPWKPARTRTFFAMCRRLYRKYLTAAATERARHAGDEVHAAACCYMRDWLIGAEYSAATKKGDIGRMIASERFMGMGFLGSGHHNYAHLILDRLLADKVLPSATSRILRVAQLVNRRGREGEFEGADHFQETLNKEIQVS